jgi:hypothetical protein
MDNLVSVQSTPQTANEYEAMIEQLLSEMTRLNEQMVNDRTEIDRLRIESSVIKAETRALLSSMGVQL